MMYAQLGNIKFNLITYFNNIDESRSWNYAKHNVIDGKPKLQCIGDNLSEMSIGLNFHSSFCNPQEELKKLVDAANLKKSMTFIFANGVISGDFVIESISKSINQTDKKGNLIAIQTQVKLTESVKDIDTKTINKKKITAKKGNKKKNIAKAPVKIKALKKSEMVKGLDASSKKNLDKAIITRKTPMEFLQKPVQLSIQQKMADKMYLKGSNPTEYNIQLTAAKAIVNKEERQNKLLEFGVFEDANF